MNARQEFFGNISSKIIEDSNNDALIIIKVCRFKEINTTYGFDKGDALLEYLQDSLNTLLRPKDIIGRIGDNEFAAYLPELKNSSLAILAANKIISEFNRNINIAGSIISPKVILGISVKPDHGKSLEELLHAATLALQSAEAKNEDYLLHQISIDKLPPSLILENEIPFALDDDEFSLHCQPKINLSNKKLYGGEALIRWNSKKYGFVNTQYFVDMLEGSRSLIPVSNWVLNKAFRQCVKYQELYPNFTMAVNLSASLLTNKNIVKVVTNAASIWAVKASTIILEVTEGAMMKNPNKSMEILNEFHQLGFGVSIDDFGTGYSSLAYLKNLPAKEIKIDKSFVLNMVNDKKDESIVKAAIELAHNLDLKVVAEGIEDEETMDLLNKLGCDYGQGYYMAKPMSDKDMMVWLENSEWL